MSLFLDNHKFSLLAFPSIPSCMQDFGVCQRGALTAATDMSEDFSLDETWKKWLGEIRTKVVERAQFYLLLQEPPQETLEVMDAQNERLKTELQGIYEGLVLQGLRIQEEAAFMSGYVKGGHVDVRGSSMLPAAIHTTSSYETSLFDLIGGHRHMFTRAALERSVTISRTRSCIGKSSLNKRINRAIGAFLLILPQNDLLERIHQFARCIDGFVASERGHGEQQFIDRTKLFIGPEWQQEMKEIYQLRNATEHLKEPDEEIYSWDSTLCSRDRRLRALERTLQAEKIAEYCILRFLRRQEIRNWFQNNKITEFWSKPSAFKSSVWGRPLDLTVPMRSFRPEYLRDEDLGL